jgi:hypothetical protein
MHVLQEQVHWVSERAAAVVAAGAPGQTTRMISRASTEFDANFKERLSDIFEGSNTVTKTMLQDRLRLLGKAVSGNKSVLAERLIATLASNGGTPNDLPLASDYITDEGQLDSGEAHGEDGNAAAAAADDDNAAAADDDDNADDEDGEE